MIGQKKLLDRIEQLIENHTFPRFSIFVGPNGSGKKTLAHELENMFNEWRVACDHVNVYELPDVKIDTIREMIIQSYKQVMTMLYIIPDADNMSNAAKNALLKVTEEPPNEAYFIMTLEDENNTLETIRSRGTVFHMNRYTPDEIYQYAKEYTNYTLHDDEFGIIKDICETPGDVNNLGKYPSEFYDYVELVVDNIAEVSIANCFKIADKVALKDTDAGYDLRLFWKAFIKVCGDRITNKDTLFYANWVAITSKYLGRLRIKGLNRRMLLDDWIMSIRSSEEEYGC